MIAKGDGLFVNGKGSVAAANNPHYEQMKTLLSGVFNKSRAERNWASTLRLQKKSVKKPLEILISRCNDGEYDPLARGEKVIILIADPDARRVSLTKVFCELYGLTRSEARVASLAVNGMSPAEIADELFVSEYTVRTRRFRLPPPAGTRCGIFSRRICQTCLW